MGKGVLEPLKLCRTTACLTSCPCSPSRVLEFTLGSGVQGQNLSIALRVGHATRYVVPARMKPQGLRLPGYGTSRYTDILD